MSFDAFLQCFQDGELDGFPSELLASAFAGDYAVLAGDSLIWRVEYPVVVDESAPKTIMFQGREYPVVYGDSSDLYISTNAHGRIDHITFNRPAAHERFYASLFSILTQTHTVVYCAGDCPPLVGKLDTVPHLPQGLIDTLGSPVVLAYPLQIREMLGA